MFTLPQVREKLGAWDESKHRRGQPKNAGQFASGGGGGSGGHHIAQSGMSPRMGILVPPTPQSPSAKPKPTPPPLPKRQQAQLAQLFGNAAPSRPPENDANYKPAKRPAAPGTGPRPANLGSPKSVDEARDQLIWLLGRSSILREQGRALGRAPKELSRELTLNINLASRLQHGFFKLPDKPPEPMTGPKAQEQPKEPPKPKQEQPKPTPAPAPQSAPQDIRHNPTLEAAFAEPPQSQPAAPSGDIRANPLLESLFGETPATTSKPTPAPKAGKPAAEKPKKGRKPRGKKGLEKEATAKANEHLRLSAEADKSGNSAAASAHRKAGALYHQAAEHHSEGRHDIANWLRHHAEHMVRSAAKSFALPSFARLL